MNRTRSMPISLSVASNVSNAFAFMSKATMATLAGSTARAVMPSLLSRNLASSTSVETASIASLKTSALITALNMNTVLLSLARK